ncbi:hypothetical protein LCGC14_1862110, partial [marine sediment metagenome]
GANQGLASVRKPIGFLLGCGGAIKARRASKTTLNWASYLPARRAILRGGVVCEILSIGSCPTLVAGIG